MSLALTGVATVALMFAPADQPSPFGTLFRTAAATAILIAFGYLAGYAAHRRPPRPEFMRTVTLGAVTIAVMSLATSLLANQMLGLAIWFLVLFASGFALNRVCDVSERHAILFAAVCVTTAAIVNVAIFHISAISMTDPSPGAGATALWRNVARIATQPTDVALVWLAWRVADRLRPRESRRPQAKPSARPA